MMALTSHNHPQESLETNIRYRHNLVECGKLMRSQLAHRNIHIADFVVNEPCEMAERGCLTKNKVASADFWSRME